MVTEVCIHTEVVQVAGYPDTLHNVMSWMVTIVSLWTDNEGVIF